MGKRLRAIALLVVLLAPGLWLRSDPPPRNDSQILHYNQIASAAGRVNAELELLGAWVLTSENTQFGGFSALTPLAGGELLAASDYGEKMQFTPPSAASGKADMRLEALSPDSDTDKFLADSESLTRNPATGQLWAGYEGANAIKRFSAKYELEATVQPAAMEGWGANSGPEAMARLPDGRFLVIAEGAASRFGNTHNALLFAGDPVQTKQPPISFTYRPPEGFAPVDAAAIADGRVLILLRRLRFMPPGFETALAIADPQQIKPGETWQGQMVARFTSPVPPENYEGLAVAKSSAQGHEIWVISDDNGTFYQRTILLKMLWTPRK